MKITIEEVGEIDETEIKIRCKSISNEILEFINEYKIKDTLIWGISNKQFHKLDPMDIYYFETIDNKVFAYTLKEVYDINHKLYELEEILSNKHFFRTSKSMILNISKITSVKSLVHARLEVKLDNKEKVIISRNNAGIFKEKLGVYKK